MFDLRLEERTYPRLLSHKDAINLALAVLVPGKHSPTGYLDLPGNGRQWPSESLLVKDGDYPQSDPVWLVNPCLQE